MKINETAVNRDKVGGTPTFMINGQKVEAGTWAELEPMLRKEIG